MKPGIYRVTAAAERYLSACNFFFILRFHTYNSARQSEPIAASQSAEDEVFARPPDQRTPKVLTHY